MYIQNLYLANCYEQKRIFYRYKHWRRLGEAESASEHLLYLAAVNVREEGERLKK